MCEDSPQLHPIAVISHPINLSNAFFIKRVLQGRFGCIPFVLAPNNDVKHTQYLPAEGCLRKKGVYSMEDVLRYPKYICGAACWSADRIKYQYVLERRAFSHTTHTHFLSLRAQPKNGCVRCVFILKSWFQTPSLHCWIDRRRDVVNTPVGGYIGKHVDCPRRVPAFCRDSWMLEYRPPLAAKWRNGFILEYTLGDWMLLGWVANCNASERGKLVPKHCSDLEFRDIYGVRIFPIGLYND